MRTFVLVTGQLGGALAALVGLYLVAGLAVALLVGGLALVLLATLAELIAPSTTTRRSRRRVIRATQGGA